MAMKFCPKCGKLLRNNETVCPACGASTEKKPAEVVQEAPAAQKVEKPAPKVQPKPQPKPEPKPAPNPKPKPQPRPEPKPQPNPEPEPKVEPQTVPVPEPEQEPREEVQFEPVQEPEVTLSAEPELTNQSTENADNDYASSEYATPEPPKKSKKWLYLFIGAGVLFIISWLLGLIALGVVGYLYWKEKNKDK